MDHAEIDRIVDCERNWNRAAERLVAAELPARRERQLTQARSDGTTLTSERPREHDSSRGPWPTATPECRTKSLRSQSEHPKRASHEAATRSNSALANSL